MRKCDNHILEVNTFSLKSEGSDYTTTSTTEMTFGVGIVGGETRIVSVDIIGDTTGEPDETFTLNLIPRDPQSDDGLTQTFTIIDDDRKYSWVRKSIIMDFLCNIRL